jgi:hypothetical protein
MVLTHKDCSVKVLLFKLVESFKTRSLINARLIFVKAVSPFARLFVVYVILKN